MELNLLPLRGTSFVSCNDELLFDIHNIVLHCLSDGATQSYLGLFEMWQPTWCFFRLHRPPSWGRRIWHGNVWLEQQHALMPAGLLWLGGGMPFGSLCAVRGRTPSLKEQASWMPWVGTVGIIGAVWKQHQDGSKYVKTCLGHPQTEGAQGRQLRCPFSCYLALINKKISLSDNFCIFTLADMWSIHCKLCFESWKPPGERTHSGKPKLNKSSGICSQANR